MDYLPIANALKDEAIRIGFDLAGITDARPSAFKGEYLDWLAQGYHGEMEYLTRNLDRRLDSSKLLDGKAASILMVAMNYYCDTDEGPGTPTVGSDEGVIARYARGDDYHDVMLPRLRALGSWLAERVPDVQTHSYVDTGPLLEREAAQRAGLGWVGKHTLLLNPQLGSYFFLGALVMSVPLPPDTPTETHCGTCTRCMDACPTNAIVEPYVLDATRCISYLTIELKGDIPVEHTSVLAKAGNRIYGCDICQEVCPFTRKFSQPTTESAYQPRAVNTRPNLHALVMLTEEEFREKFRQSPIKRAKHRGLIRNVKAALDQGKLV